MKSYNELSRWYSALEPESESDTGAPARPDTAEPVAGDDDSIDRYSTSPDSTPTPEHAPVGERQPEPFSLDLDDQSNVTGDSHSRAAGQQSKVVGDPHGSNTESEPKIGNLDGWNIEPRSNAVDERDSSNVEPRRNVADDHDRRPIQHLSNAKVDPFDRATEFDDATTESADFAPPEYGKRPHPVVPDPVPPPPAQLAGRRSDFTGGWSDWVADPAPGPDDDYDAELVQFPWPEATDDDYDDARVLEPSGALRASRKRQRAWVVLAVSLLVLVIAATGVFFLLFGRGDSDTAGHAAPPLHFTAGNLTADTAGSCPTERTDIVVRSAEAGGTDSGPDAVLAFQYAYYVTRSGEQARAVATPDADVSPAAVIQRGIDTIPVGTTHCVRITTVAADRFTVEITEFRPAGAPATYTKQSVRTALVGDRTLITGIAAG
ncbi:hypothetical protein [Nocardia sp. XZ_19_231]|uniref:hypothetical protein n=1 Tax=Nocardia sp. XZ_19_231 TaxID=2769252 RepID=UPI00188F6417|nr:hypothetical protein [Nocardia sp. XZ_19_231]